MTSKEKSGADAHDNHVNGVGADVDGREAHRIEGIITTKVTIHRILLNAVAERICMR